MSTPSVPSPSRRAFLTKGALLGFAASPVAALAASGQKDSALLNSKRPDSPYGLADPENIIYSVCLNCNTGCGIKCKLEDGVLTKIDGSAYSPWTMVPHLPMSTSLETAALVDGGLCPKGQSGLQGAYDPYRIRKVLKRAGQRGENKWVSIDFGQAVTEIVEGGKLFAGVPGEQERQVEGLRGIRALTDAKLSKTMSDDVAAIWAKKMTVAEFKTKHAAHLDKLIDPDHPDFGPKNNQFVINWGRRKAGRSEFIKRFGDGYGTTNLHGHTTVCQGSLYFACKAMSEQYTADGKFSGGKKWYWQADLENSRYVLFVGANLFEGNYGPTNRTVRLTENLATGRTKIAVADPRFSKLAGKAAKWLPINPGTDMALAMAILRWMIENDRYDKKFTANANKAAATADKEKSWTNLTWLVKIDAKTGQPGSFARASETGVAPAEKRLLPDPADATKTMDYEEKFFVVMQDGKPVAVDPNDTKTPIKGDLLVDGTLPDGTRVKSGLQLIKEAAFERSIADWCAEAGLDPNDVVAVARNLAAAGKQGVVDIHRGVSQHTNGFHAVMAFMTINTLLGNFDWAGGSIAGGTYGYDGSKAGPFKLGTQPGKLTPFGISVIRHEVDYEKTTIFKGYPTPRNWYPLSSDIYEEIFPSMGDAYPYGCKALFMLKAAPTYALPAGQTIIEILVDLKKMPLVISSDILVGTTSMYADYIFPDLSFLERWELHGTHPNIAQRVQPLRQPVIAPIPENHRAFGQEMPMSFESFFIAVAEKLGLPGFGKDAFGPGLHLNRPEDFYVRAAANLAFGEKPDGSDSLPEASDRELEIFLKARRHLPKTVFDAEAWKALVGDEKLWRRTVFLLNRGGRFMEHSKTYKDKQVTVPYGALLCMYQEKTAKCKYTGTGKNYPGYARYIPIQDYHGKSLDHLAVGYDLALITHRTISQCKTRTITNPWLTPLMPENSILINPVDARRLGLQHGARAKVVSATNKEGEWDMKNGTRKPMVGTLNVTETIRPGTISFALGFGLWATGADDIQIDGVVIQGEKRRGLGLNANAAMWTDPQVPNTALFDPVGGSVSFYDTRVRLEPAHA